MEERLSSGGYCREEICVEVEAEERSGWIRWEGENGESKDGGNWRKVDGRCDLLFINGPQCGAYLIQCQCQYWYLYFLPGSPVSPPGLWMPAGKKAERKANLTVSTRR